MAKRPQGFNKRSIYGYDRLAGILGEWNSTWAKAEGINGYSDLTIGVLVCRPVMASSVLAMQISGFVSDLNMLFPGHAISGTGQPEPILGVGGRFGENSCTTQLITHEQTRNLRQGTCTHNIFLVPKIRFELQNVGANLK